MKEYRLKKKVKVLITLVGVCAITITTLKVSNILINATRNDNETKEVSIKGADKLTTKQPKTSASTDLKGELEAMLDSEPRVQTVIDNFEKYPEEIIKLLIGKPKSIEYALEFLNEEKNS